jgi:hypothetical protein
LGVIVKELEKRGGKGGGGKGQGMEWTEGNCNSADTPACGLDNQIEIEKETHWHKFETGLTCGFVRR